MRVTIERSAFLKALNHVQSVVERRNTIPILSNVLVHAKGDAIKLTATDLDIEIIETVSAEVAQEGAVTVAAHMLYDIVRKLPDGAQLELDQGPDAGRVSVKAGRSRFALQALPPEDFPDLNAGELANRFTLSAADLKGLVEKTRFAISTEETRYYLNGIYLHEVAASKVLRAVATDGHRLARAQVALPAGAKGMPGIIVPRKTVLELVKLIESDGWQLVRTRGSHRQYKHPTKKGLITVPGKPNDSLIIKATASFSAARGRDRKNVSYDVAGSPSIN